MDRRSFLTNAIVTAGCVSFAPSSISQTSNISQCEKGLYLADYLEKYFTVGVGQSGNTYWGEYYIYRAFLYFDTSTIPSNAIIKKGRGINALAFLKFHL